MSLDPRYNRKLLLCLLLLLLNIIIRIPSTPHEIGGDTYLIHALANSITNLGAAGWWVHWLSVFGMYSYSYSSSVPFLLSGLSQLGNLDMELTVLLFSVLIGTFSIAAAYLMAGSIYDDFLFKFLMALFFSTSSGILQFTLWNASSRGLFLVLFLLFIYILLSKGLNSPKKIVLLAILFILLRSTHNFVYFTIPLVVIFLFQNLLLKVNITLNTPKKVNYNYLYLFIFVFILIIPFFTRLFMTGSRYQYLIDMLITTTRYIGPTIIFVIPAILYLSLKNNKNKDEWFILLSSLSFIPIFYSLTYGKFIVLPILIFYICLGFKNLLSVNKKTFLIFSIFMICSLILFSSFFNHFRIGSSQDSIYLKEETNSAALWTTNYIAEDTGVYTYFAGREVWRMLAISDGHIKFPATPPLAISYGFVDDVTNTTAKVSPLSLSFYFEGAYVQKQGTSKWGEYSWYSNFDIDDPRVVNFIEKYGLEYLVRDINTYKPIMDSVKEENNLIYSNGRIEIWDI